MITNDSENCDSENQKVVVTDSKVHSIYTFDIHSTDTDYKDQIQMHSLFSMMQEAASRNADVYGWGPEVLDKIDTCWLLLRVSVRMDTLPSWLDKISIETWSRGTDRLYFLRDFIFYDEAGVKIGVGTSIWILANKSTHRPVRPAIIMDMAKVLSDKSASMPFNTPKITPLADVKSMKENLSNSNTITKYADFSEIDRNHHVNNTRYVAWCLDAAHNRSLEQGDILGVDINYNSEIHFGEKVVLFKEEDPNKNLQVDGYVDGEDRIAFSAILYTSETICSNLQ